MITLCAQFGGNINKQDVMKIAIINRSFWPTSPVVGAGLLRFAEDASKEGHKVFAVFQERIGIKAKLKAESRGLNVVFFPCFGLSTSSSSIFIRAFDALFFMTWALITLLWVRPDRVYVSTDPPIVVPFIVMCYSKIYRKKYIYHIQDIHPEASNVVLSVNKFLYKILLVMDNMVIFNSWQLITLTNQMASSIRARSRGTFPIHLVDNPAIEFKDIEKSRPKNHGIVFCGNAGRLQRIPLILEAIDVYYRKGGCLKFLFAGSGVYSGHLKHFSEIHEKFHYFGQISALQAAELNANHTWALLPIEDEVTKYAFPSKLSSYIHSGANILAVCGEDTSVAEWVNENELGIVVAPDVVGIVDVFFKIEEGVLSPLEGSKKDKKLYSNFHVENFSLRLQQIILGKSIK